MFERTEQNEQEKGTRLPTSLAMPQQAPPVNRTRTTAADPEDTSGVEASFNLGRFLKNVLI
ncbi:MULTISPECIES: hypothetical protein [Streptomyces]|uniref:Uncharacterized protein n=2 Tax=Streptomyces TaxID=1883 RepID=A0ABS9JJT9_9ACTN|nr:MULTISPECIES: hypothetical protein [Streptomyces]MCG0065838.1 hypothetical protein [Streptomyces tricolor]OYP19839.1 hypothetical protein CFC35_39700 [Streptomyces sp. FBKL.4005]BCM72730.1 hypothetical protein EASAB2608_08064 [Streptomyces sp. EAS-AB2608]CUW33017.1 hypothetical protein TUE45_pSRTUE45c_0385 [Streptomyces reticuli]